MRWFDICMRISISIASLIGALSHWSLKLSSWGHQLNFKFVELRSVLLGHNEQIQLEAKDNGDYLSIGKV